MSEPFILGVNYWPRRKAMSWWSDFDKGEVDDEFALIKSYGMTLVRIFLLWDDFQKSPDSISSKALSDLETVFEIAEKHSLKLDVTFFTGHMSGPNWAPGWSLEGSPLAGARKLVCGGQIVNSSYLNPFHNPLMISAEKKLITEVVSIFKDHSALYMWNLGNEPDLFSINNNESATDWVKIMTEFIHSIDVRHPVTCGLHSASLSEVNSFRVDEVFAHTDIAVMHAYPMYSDIAEGPLDYNYVPFTCALASALCGKPVMMEEFGGCTSPAGGKSEIWNWKMYGEDRTQFMAGEEDFAVYLNEVLPRLVDAGATGALIWCFADYDSSLWNKPPCDEVRHERYFGLVRPDGSIKPHVEVIKKFADSRPFVKEDVRKVELGMSSEDYYKSPYENMKNLYRKYIENI